MLVAIDAVGIRGEGGAAVLSELVRWLPDVRPDWRWHVYLFERSLRDFDGLPTVGTVRTEETGCGDGPLARWYWIRSQLQQRVRALGADVLLELANVASGTPCVPQVVLVQQSLPFCAGVQKIFSIRKRVQLRVMRSLILRGARASRAVIVQTRSLGERLQRLEPPLRGRVHVVPSGYRTASSPPAIRRQVQDVVDAAGRPRLVYISLPRKHKNHLALLRAFSLILRVFPQASLILTEGPSETRDRRVVEVRNGIRNEIRRSGLGAHVIPFDWLTPGEVAYIHRRCDLAVFPSLAESFGLPLAEALEAGCPVAAADLPYAHDVAEDAAVYFNPFSSESIAECVVSFLQSSEQAQRVRAAAERRRAVFAPATIAGQIAEILESAARAPDTRRKRN